MRRVGVVSFTLASLLLVGLWAKNNNANSKSEDKCNNGLGNDKEKCYEGDKADSINGNAYGLSKNKFADDVSENNDSVVVDEELQQANEEKLTEFEEKHNTIAKNFLLIQEVPSEIEIISETPQYVNGEVVSRVYNLGTKSSARAIGEDNISGYMVMTLNESDVPIKAYSFDTKYEDLYEPYREFLNLQLYEMKKLSDINTNVRKATPPPSHAKAWGYLKKFKNGDTIPQIDLVLLDVNIGKIHKSNKNKQKKFKSFEITNEPLTTTKWDQYYPYNLFMPQLPESRMDIYGNIEDSNFSFTGCTPTAWAQVMKYHKWPPRGVGITPDYNVSDYNLTFALEVSGINLDRGFDYNWSDKAMYLEYIGTEEVNLSGEIKKQTKEYKEEEYENIAYLMSDISHALECQYYKNKTLCFMQQDKISKFFGYSTNMNMSNYDFKSSEINFKRVVTRDINNSMPLMFAYWWYSEQNSTFEGNLSILGNNIHEDGNKTIIGYGTNLTYSGIYTDLKLNVKSTIDGEQYIDYNRTTITTISGDITKSEGNITITNGYILIDKKGIEISHTAIIDGYQDINDTGFAVSLNLGLHGNNNNFYLFSSSENYFQSDNNLIDDLTHIRVIDGILPCSIESGDCNTTYLTNGGMTKKHNLNINIGWQLKALKSDKYISSEYFEDGTLIYTYEYGEMGHVWYKNPSTIKPKQGFWIKAPNKTSYLTVGSDDNSSLITITPEDAKLLDNHWHILGAGKEINVNEVFGDNFLIWIYDNISNSWFDNSNFDKIKAGQGFWIKRNSSLE